MRNSEKFNGITLTLVEVIQHGHFLGRLCQVALGAPLVDVKRL